MKETKTTFIEVNSQVKSRHKVSVNVTVRQTASDNDKILKTLLTCDNDKTKTKKLKDKLLNLLKPLDRTDMSDCLVIGHSLKNDLSVIDVIDLSNKVIVFKNVLDYDENPEHSILDLIEDGQVKVKHPDKDAVIMTNVKGFTLIENGVTTGYDMTTDKDKLVDVIKTYVESQTMLQSDDYVNVLKKWLGIYNDDLLQKVLLPSNETIDKIESYIKIVKLEAKLYQLKSKTNEGLEYFECSKWIKDVRYNRTFSKKREVITIMNLDANEFIEHIKCALKPNYKLTPENQRAYRYFTSDDNYVDSLYDKTRDVIKHECDVLMTMKDKDRQDNVGSSTGDVRSYDGSLSNEGATMTKVTTTYDEFLKTMFPIDKGRQDDVKESLTILVSRFIRHMEELVDDEKKAFELYCQSEKVHQEYYNQKKKVILKKYLDLKSQKSKNKYYEHIAIGEEKDEIKKLRELEKEKKEIQVKFNTILNKKTN